MFIFWKLQTAAWQTARSARNLAAHDDETDYHLVAEHFNTLHDLRLPLYGVARRFLAYSRNELLITPTGEDFAADFDQITANQS